MFDAFDFHLEQLASIKAAMTTLPTFQPDNMTPANVGTIITDAETFRSVMQTQVSTIALARGELQEVTDEMHDLCVQVYAIMKSRYRFDPGSYDAISKLPVDDDKPTATFQRGQALSKLWEILPNPPGSASPFKAWDTMGRTEFDAKLGLLETALNDMATVEQAYERTVGDFRAKRAAMQKWVTAALVQGRGQFRRGTPAREQIDAVPTLSRTPKPGEAGIVSASSPGPGVLRIQYESNHATSYRLLSKGPGATAYTIFQDHLTSDIYEGSGLAPGVHRFKAVGRNSRGLGPESEPVEVTIMEN